METETKFCDMKIKGGVGDVDVHSIQKHYPTDDMILIKTERSFTLFCQKNHPIIVKMEDDEEYVISAGSVSCSDQIFVDNSVMFSDEKWFVNIDVLTLSEDLKSGLGVSELCTKYPSLFRGKEFWDFRFCPDFVLLAPSWIFSFLSGLFEDSFVFYTYSYNLLSQLKLMADRCHVCVDINVMDTSDGPLFSIFQKNGCDIEAEYNLSYIGFDRVCSFEIIKSWRNPVYDIKTETGEFMIGCMQTHNSFHTGGAVNIKRSDILKMMMENIDDALETLIRKEFYQDEDTLKSNADFVTIEIMKDIYQDDNKIKQDSEFLSIPVGNFDLKFGGLIIPMTIEEETKFYLQNAQREETDTHIVLSYSKNAPIFRLEPSVLAPEEVARRLDRYVGGKSPWTTPESLYTKFYKILSPFGDWDSVHLETILANILRWKPDPHFPARVKYPYNPKTYSIKDLPSVMSWPLGLAFENYGKSITYGLISDRGAESSIEKVFFGESLSDL